MLSTSGDFQRKWQASCIAEADLERVGYVFLEKRTVAAPRTYFAEISDILLMRHVSIVGGKDNPHDSEVGDGDAQ